MKVRVLTRLSFVVFAACCRLFAQKKLTKVGEGGHGYSRTLLATPLQLV